MRVPREIVVITVVTLIAIGATVSAPGAEVPGELRVGFAQVDITPPVGTVMTGPRLPVSVGMEDPLRAKALVIANGEKTLAIVGLDLVKIRYDLSEAAIAEACERTGLAPDAILICPSHNHSSPWIPRGGPNNARYLAGLPGRIADSIAQAHAALEPARMLLGRSLIYEGHNNRRLLSKTDGLALNTWLDKLNDLKETPQVLGTEGPIDPEMWVVRFDALDGNVLGTLVNFTCHPHHRERAILKSWSADFPGVIADHIAQEFGADVVSVFTQGAAGNINPAAEPSAAWREKAAVLAEAAVEAANSVVAVEGPIAVAGIRRNLEVPLTDFEKQREGAIERLGWRPERFEAARQSAMKGPKTREIPINAARIGPLAIASNPGELFVEWGIEVKRRSPFPHTIVSAYTNDSIGYEPTELAFEREGYETLAGVNFVSLEGIRMQVDAVVELLEELWREAE